MSDEKKKEEKDINELNYRFFPDHVLTELNIWIFLIYLSTILAIIFPPEMAPKANPLVTPLHIKPEWYFFPMYKWIKMTPQMVGIMVPVVVVLIFIFWPFVDAFIARVTKNELLPRWIGIAGMLFVTCLMAIEAMH